MSTKRKWVRRNPKRSPYFFYGEKTILVLHSLAFLKRATAMEIQSHIEACTPIRYMRYHGARNASQMYFVIKTLREKGLIIGVWEKQQYVRGKSRRWVVKNVLTEKGKKNLKDFRKRLDDVLTGRKWKSEAAKIKAAN